MTRTTLQRAALTALFILSIYMAVHAFAEIPVLSAARRKELAK